MSRSEAVSHLFDRRNPVGIAKLFRLEFVMVLPRVLELLQEGTVSDPYLRAFREGFFIGNRFAHTHIV